MKMISNSGHRKYCDMAKAIGVGADCIIMEKILADSDETLGKILIKDGKRVKLIRGMAGVCTNL